MVDLSAVVELSYIHNARDMASSMRGFDNRFKRNAEFPPVKVGGEDWRISAQVQKDRCRRAPVGVVRRCSN